MCMTHHYNRNRQIVLQGLEHRKELREEAALDAAERRFYEEINCHSKSNLKAIADAKEAQRREAARKAAEAASKARRVQLEYERRVREAQNWRKCLFLTFGSLMIAVAQAKLFATGVAPIWLSVPLVIAACLFSFYSFVSYLTRNLRRKGAKA